jgi:hypothetical protein
VIASHARPRYLPHSPRMVHPSFCPLIHMLGLAFGLVSHSVACLTWIASSCAPFYFLA